MGESMTREREELSELLEQLLAEEAPTLKYRADMLHAEVSKAMLRAYTVGREQADIGWDALRSQWRIEFDRELGQEGGHIMNVVDSVRELVREEREKVLADFRTVRPNSHTVAAAIRARGVAKTEEK